MIAVQHEASRRHEQAAWLLFLGVALLVRIAALKYESFWHDELFTLTIIDGPFARALEPHAEINQIPPLHFMLVWIWKSAFGGSEFILRLFSALCGWGAIVILGEMLRRRISPLAGWICAIGMLAHVALVTNSMFARAYALEIFAAGALIVFADALMNPDTRRYGLAAFFYAFTGAALVGIHYFAAFFWALATIAVVATLFFERQPAGMRKAGLLLAWCLICGGLALILLLPGARAHLQVEGAGTWIPQVWGEGFQIRAAARAIFELLGARTAEGFSPLSVAGLPLALLLSAGIAYAAILPNRNAGSRRLGILFATLSFGQILIALAAMTIINVLQTRYLITAAVAFCGAVAIAGSNTGRRPWLRLVVGAQILLMACTTIGYFSGNRIIERWDVVVPPVAAQLRAGDALIFFPPVQQLNFEYRMPGRQLVGTAVESLPRIGSSDYPAGITRRIPELLNQYRRLLIFSHHEHVWDPQMALRNALDAQQAQIEERELPGRNWKLLIVTPGASTENGN